MRTFVFAKNGQLATFEVATTVVAAGIYRRTTINNAVMGDWAAEAALHHHHVVGAYSKGEYPEVFESFFMASPDVSYSHLHGGYIYTWKREKVSVLIKD